MLLAVLLQLALSDSFPQVTLDEALRRATRLNPGYVAALGRVDNAEWGRRAARLVFILPAVSASTDATRYSTSFFNIGTGQPQSTSVTAQVDARYELFSLRKLADLSRTSAEVQSAEAGEVKARFSAALLTESDYYAVLAAQELARVTAERVRRAEEQLLVARARVVSGAAVQTDSLQLMLELSRAQVDRLRQDAALRVARLELGRRVGDGGQVDAAPLDTLPAPPLPYCLHISNRYSRGRPCPPATRSLIFRASFALLGQERSARQRTNQGGCSETGVPKGGSCPWTPGSTLAQDPVCRPTRDRESAAEQRRDACAFCTG